MMECKPETIEPKDEFLVALASTISNLLERMASEVRELRALYREARQEHYTCDVGGYQNYGEEEWNRETKCRLEAAEKAHCSDCGRKYGDAHGFPDLVIPDDVWEKIAPTDGNGLLCPSCICHRLHQAGIKTTGQFTSGPLVQTETMESKDETTILTDNSDEVTPASGPSER